MQHNGMKDAIAAGTPDVSLSPTPNWADIVTAGDVTPMQQLLGIDSRITIGVTTSAMPVYVAVTVYIGTSNNVVVAKAYPIALGVQANFDVMPGMWMGFAADDGGNGVTGTIQVKNVSNSNTVLDTINVIISA